MTELICRSCKRPIRDYEHKLEWCSGYYATRKGGGGHGWKARVQHGEWAHERCAQKDEDGVGGMQENLL